MAIVSTSTQRLHRTEVAWHWHRRRLPTEGVRILRARRLKVISDLPSSLSMPQQMTRLRLGTADTMCGSVAAWQRGSQAWHMQPWFGASAVWLVPPNWGEGVSGVMWLKRPEHRTSKSPTLNPVCPVLGKRMLSPTARPGQLQTFPHTWCLKLGDSDRGRGGR